MVEELAEVVDQLRVGAEARQNPGQGRFVGQRFTAREPARQADTAAQLRQHGLQPFGVGDRVAGHRKARDGLARRACRGLAGGGRRLRARGGGEVGVGVNPRIVIAIRPVTRRELQ